MFILVAAEKYNFQCIVMAKILSQWSNDNIPVVPVLLILVDLALAPHIDQLYFKKKWIMVRKVNSIL